MAGMEEGEVKGRRWGLRRQEVRGDVGEEGRSDEGVREGDSGWRRRRGGPSTLCSSRPCIRCCSGKPSPKYTTNRLTVVTDVRVRRGG